MIVRQALPRIWLVTDERAEPLAAIDRLPARSGILLRHYSLPPTERRALFETVRRRARRSGHLLLLAGGPLLAKRWGADGWHGPGRGAGLHSASVHDVTELRAAVRGGASLVFVSPVFPTRSHPNAPTLGLGGFARLAHQTRLPVIALGGVQAEDVARLRALGAYGWAGIDAWDA